MGAWFEKTHEQLKEAFILGRLAELGFTCGSDPRGFIDRLSDAEGGAEKPSARWESRFLEMSSLCHVGLPLELLHEGATKLDELVSGGFIFDEKEMFSSIYGALSSDLYLGVHNKIFVDWDKRCLISMSDRLKAGDPLQSIRATAYSLDHQVIDTAVRDVLFAEWKERRPRCEIARAILVDALCEELRQRCKKAEADFDRAIAVSADGTKIVHADWIVVAGSVSWIEAMAIIYPASAFKEKLLRSPKMERQAHQGGIYMPEACYADEVERIKYALKGKGTQLSAHRLGYELHPNYLNNGGSLQRLVEYRLGDEPTRRFLLTTRDFCPVPLPVGGVQVYI